MARVATQKRDALCTLPDGTPRVPEAAASPIIRLHDISKAFGPTLANDRLSLAISPGEVVGLVGANGAGVGA